MRERKTNKQTKTPLFSSISAWSVADKGKGLCKYQYSETRGTRHNIFDSIFLKYVCYIVHIWWVFLPEEKDASMSDIKVWCPECTEGIWFYKVTSYNSGATLSLCKLIQCQRNQQISANLHQLRCKGCWKKKKWPRYCRTQKEK